MTNARANQGVPQTLTTSRSGSKALTIAQAVAVLYRSQKHTRISPSHPYAHQDKPQRCSAQALDILYNNPDPDLAPTPPLLPPSNYRCGLPRRRRRRRRNRILSASYPIIAIQIELLHPLRPASRTIAEPPPASKPTSELLHPVRYPSSFAHDGWQPVCVVEEGR